VFQVIPDGRFVAYSADKGEKLLEVQTGLKGGMGPPITYVIDGKQYVALMGGMGTLGGNRGAPPPPPPPAAGPAPAAGAGANVSPDVANAQAADQRAAGTAGAAPPPPANAPPFFTPGPSPKLLVFMLDGSAPLPNSQQ